MKELTGVIQKSHIHHQAAGQTYNEGMQDDNNKVMGSIVFVLGLYGTNHFRTS